MIANGDALASKIEPDPSRCDSSILGDFIAWRVSVINLLDGLMPLSRIYLEEFRRITDINRIGSPLAIFQGPSEFNAYAAVGVLKQLKKEALSGNMRFNDLFAADMFDDFLEMSKHLCDKGYLGYLVAAASVSTAVLENALRRMGKDRSVPIEDDDTLDALNHKCAKSGVYSGLWRGMINGWAAIRNDVDHGHFDKFKKSYTKKEIKDMVDGIEQFLAANLKLTESDLPTNP